MTGPPDESGSARAAWLRSLARAPAASLDARSAALVASHGFETLRAPEVGLTMIRARIGNTGNRFNLGEATVTRCAVRHVGPDGAATVGVGYLLGRNEAHCLRIAQIDALLQRDDLRERLLRELVGPLDAERDSADQAERDRAEASRVRFFSLDPDPTS